MRINANPDEMSSKFELAFPGTYQARVYANKPGSGPKGPYLKWELELLDVTTNSEGQPVKGKIGHVFETTTLKEGARWRLIQLAEACGLDGSNFDTDEILGKELTVQLDVEKDEGYDPRNSVKKFVKS